MVMVYGIGFAASPKRQRLGNCAWEFALKAQPTENHGFGGPFTLKKKNVLADSFRHVLSDITRYYQILPVE